MSVLAIIPARGGSKGIIKKNLRSLGGKPLLQYPIESAKACGLVDQIVISTDDIEIEECARSLEVEVIQRPPEISGDNALVIDAIRHVLAVFEKRGYVPEIIVLLECTSPFRNEKDLRIAIKILQEGIYDSIATFKETDLSPGRIWHIQGDQAKPFLTGADPFEPRQKQPIGYQLTGEIYGFRTSPFHHNTSNSLIFGKFHPILSTSKYFIDIDLEIDFVMAEAILNFKEKQ